jgi:predicted DNA-binding protein with PD1-like motif
MLKSFKSADEVIVGRIPMGADIIRSIEAVCAERNIKTAWVQALGAVKKATIAYYTQDTHQYNTREFAGGYEIVSCSGNITLKDGKQFGHLHIVLSDENYSCFAGHLMPGTVEVFACEYTILPLQGDELIRKPDANTGLALWCE